MEEAWKQHREAGEEKMTRISGGRFRLLSGNMVDGVRRTELGASSHFGQWQSVDCTQANLDPREFWDALFLGNRSGLIHWQHSLLTSSDFSTPLCSVAWFSWDGAPCFWFAYSAIDCPLHSQDV